jgi:membrane-associated protease RseP (regulator of RpoE activity)
MAMLVAFLMISMWLIGIYNLGYILTAKILGYTVSHSSIGTGRMIYQFTLGATTFRLGALPTGGNVTIKRHEVTFRRLILTCAGPATLILFALFLTWLQLIIGFQKVEPGGAIVIDSTSAETGLKSGDLIIATADHPIQSGLDLSEHLAGWKSGELVLTVARDSQVRQVKLTYVPGTDGRLKPLGIVFSSLTQTKRFGPFEALKKTPEAILKLVTALMVSEGSVVPPNIFSSVLTINGWLGYMVVHSLLIGVTNLIPVPPLVGGDALVIAIGLIRKRRKTGDPAGAKGIAGISGVLFAGILVGFGIYTLSWNSIFLCLWLLLLALFFLDSALRVIRTTFGGRSRQLLIVTAMIGIPLLFLICRIGGLSLPVPKADRIAQIVRWTELNRYWSP